LLAANLLSRTCPDRNQQVWNIITNTAWSELYIDIHTTIGSDGSLRTKIYDKGGDFIFNIMNFPFMCSIIPAVPACGAYHISIHMIFQSCWFLSGRVLDRRFAANKEQTNGIDEIHIVTKHNII
jgi:hypothetical protein